MNDQMIVFATGKIPFGVIVFTKYKPAIRLR